MDDDEFKLTIAYAMLDLQRKFDGLKEYFKDNIDFIHGMGNVAEELANILHTSMDKYDLANKLAVDQFERTSDFYKKTISQKYPNNNIVQEFMIDVIVDVIVALSPQDNKAVFNWMQMKMNEFNGQYPNAGELDIRTRVDSAEAIFRASIAELGSDELTLFVCRTLYIPFITFHYFTPMNEYPYYEEWVQQLREFKASRNV